MVAVVRCAVALGLTIPDFFTRKFIGKIGSAREIFECSAVHMVSMYAAQNVPPTARPGVDFSSCLEDLGWWQQRLLSNTPAKLVASRALPSASQVVGFACSDAAGGGGVVATLGDAVALTLDACAGAHPKLLAAELVLRRYGRLFRGLTLSAAVDDGAVVNSLLTGSTRDDVARPRLATVLQLSSDLDVRLLGAPRASAAAVVVPAGYLRA